MKKYGKKIFIALTLCSVMFFATDAGSAVVDYLGNAYFLSSVFQKTAEAYSEEIESLFKDNAVIEKIAEIASGSYTQSFITDEFSFEISEDLDANCAAVNFSFEGFDGTVNSYLNDSQLIFGSDQLMNFELDPTSVGSDIYSFIELNKELLGIQDLDDLDDLGDITVLRDILDSIDFSYSGSKSMPYTENAYDFKPVMDSLGTAFGALIDRADFEKTKSEIELGTEVVDCDLFILTFDLPRIVDWLKTDFRKVITENEEIQSIFYEAESFNELMYGEDFGYSYDDIIYEYDAMIEDLEDDIEDAEDAYIYVELYIYEDVIVAYYLELGEEDSYSSLTLAAVGAERRLDSVFFITEADGEILYYAAVDTDRSDPDVFRSIIETYDYSNYDNSVETFEIEWNTKQTINNFSVAYTLTDDYSDYTEDHSFTFAIDKDSVIFAQTQEEPHFAWVLEPLASEIKIPENTKILRDLKLEEIMGELESIIGMFVY